MAWNKIGDIAALSLAIFLAACGGDSSSNSPENISVADSDLVVATFDDLPVCSGKREGATAYVVDEKNAYNCINNIWMNDASSSSSVGEYNQTERMSSNIAPNSSSSFYNNISSEYILFSSSTKFSSSAVLFIDQSSSSSSKSSSSVDNMSSSAKIKTAEEFLNPKISYGEITDLRDGQKYKTVKIGKQTWMAQNLNFEYNQGSAKSYCYNNDKQECIQQGRLYSWPAAMDSAAIYNDDGEGCGCRSACKNKRSIIQGVCPQNWHLPSTDDWQELFEYVGGLENAGKFLKASNAWSGGDYFDDFGFSVIPSGYMWAMDKFQNSGVTNFWTSVKGGSCAEIFYFLCTTEWVFSSSSDYASSIRCIKNN